MGNVRLTPAAAALAASCALGACATERQQVSEKEDLLAAAGFTIRPANTPQRAAAMRAFPPHRFVRQVSGQNVAYLYADPLVCNCLYVGDQQAYGRYRQEVFQRRLADEQRFAAEAYADSAFDWRPWGPGPWWGY
jgi:hypothetical protein